MIIRQRRRRRQNTVQWSRIPQAVVHQGSQNEDNDKDNWYARIITVAQWDGRHSFSQSLETWKINWAIQVYLYQYHYDFIRKLMYIYTHVQVQSLCNVPAPHFIPYPQYLIRRCLLTYQLLYADNTRYGSPSHCPEEAFPNGRVKYVRRYLNTIISSVYFIRHTCPSIPNTGSFRGKAKAKELQKTKKSHPWWLLEK